MNYFPWHIGDYTAHTAHLEPMEDLAYRRLLEQYYLREGPLPADIQTTAKLIRLRSCISDVEAVLNEFFTLSEFGWAHERCDREIAHMQDKQAKARASAELSVNARRANAEKKQANAERSLPDSLTDVELPTPTPTPIVNTEPKGSSSPAKLPTCPTSEIIDLYHAALPELPKVRLETKDRVRAIRKTWDWALTSRKSDQSRRAETREQALDWFKTYFEHARNNDFLMGRTPRTGEHANWQCDLDFLLTDRGMKQVIEKTRETA